MKGNRILLSTLGETLNEELSEYEHQYKFLFITGITKESHVNIFSRMNQLNDISLNEIYASLYGISDLPSVFKRYVRKLL